MPLEQDERRGRRMAQTRLGEQPLGGSVFNLWSPCSAHGRPLKSSSVSLRRTQVKQRLVSPVQRAVLLYNAGLHLTHFEMPKNGKTMEDQADAPMSSTHIS